MPRGGGNFSRNPGKWRTLFSGRVWGKTGLSKGPLGPYNPFRSYRSPESLMGNQFLHKTMFSRAPRLAEKVPGPVRTLRGPNLGSGVPKIGPGVENTKVACRKAMQNPVVGIQNGAIWCKLGWKTILGQVAKKSVWALTECGLSVWALSVGTECGHSVWALSVGTQCGHSVWALSVGIQCGHSVWALSLGITPLLKEIAILIREPSGTRRHGRIEWIKDVRAQSSRTYFPFIVASGP